MRVEKVLCAAVLLLSLVQIYASTDDKKKKKLQIGVKKRVENCGMKSRKGDTLHMHYTVHGEPLLLFLFLSKWTYK